MKASLSELVRIRVALEIMAGVRSLDDFPIAALRSVASAMDAESYTYNEMDLRREVVHACILPEDAAPPVAAEIYAAHMWDHPVLGHFAATRSPGARAISEFLTRRGFRSTGLYSALYRRLGYEDHAGFFLTVRGSPAIAIGIGRKLAFTAEDLSLMNVLRLHLDTCRRALAAEDSLAKRTRSVRLLIEKQSEEITALSVREREVLAWMAEGKTNPEIAIILRISTNTVRNHAAAILGKLGVENRLAAARLARGPGPQ